MKTYDLYSDSIYVTTVDLHHYVNIDAYLKTAFPEIRSPKLVQREPRTYIKQYE